MLGGCAHRSCPVFTPIKSERTRRCVCRSMCHSPLASWTYVSINDHQRHAHRRSSRASEAGQRITLLSPLRLLPESSLLDYNFGQLRPLFPLAAVRRALARLSNGLPVQQCRHGGLAGCPRLEHCAQCPHRSTLPLRSRCLEQYLW